MKKAIIIVSVLLVIVTGIGIYFAVRDINNSNMVRSAYPDQNEPGGMCGTPILMQYFHKDPGVLTCGDYEYIMLEDGSAEIVNYHGTEREVIIPVLLENHRVTAIGADAFFHSGVVAVSSDSQRKPNDPLPYSQNVEISPPKEVYNGPESIIIPEGITIIKSRAFSLCDKLSSVTLPASVSNIEEDALPNNKNLTVTAPRGSVAEQYCKTRNILFRDANGSSLSHIMIRL